MATHPVEPQADDDTEAAAPNPSHLPVEPEFAPLQPPGEPEDPPGKAPSV